MALAVLLKLNNLALSVIELLAAGEIGELLERIANLGRAMYQGFGLIEGELWKELVGFDLTKPLGPQMMY